MNSSDMEFLLQPITADAPCGMDLSYDAAFLALEEATRGKPEQQMGAEIRPAEEPDWRAVRKQCLEILQKTRDLRVLIWLATAELVIHGLPGLADAVGILTFHVDQCWDTVHPRLDPDDNNDPTMRVNIIAAFSPAHGTSDSLRFTDRLLAAPLCQSRQLGPVTLKDLLLSAGEIKPVAEQSVKSKEEINGIFNDTSLEELRAASAASTDVIAQVDFLDRLLSQRVATGKSANFDVLKKNLQAINNAFTGQLARRGDPDAPAHTGAGSAFDQSGDGDHAMQKQLRSRQEALAMLERACLYFDTYEPSSPVQLVLRRAARLASMSFIDVIRELAADAEGQVRIATGAREPTGETK